MSGRFEDHRGVIQDWFGPGTPDGEIDSVTYILTKRGMVRGNHVHRETTQWTFVLSGKLLMANRSTQTEMEPGVCMKHAPGDPHAWRALEDSECFVFTRGPRAGDQYETDTIRLDEPLLT